MTPTEERIDKLLKENTGSHFLDSGGAYGRHWQRNQDRDFSKEPACSVHLRTEGEEITEFWVTYNLFHFLRNFLEWDETAQKYEKEFYEFAGSDEMKDETWEDCLDAFCKSKKWEVERGDYTYNHENILSQDIIYNPFEDENGDRFMIIRVHGGADARGGFTAPAFFSGVSGDYFYIAMSRAYAACTGHSKEVKEGVNGLFNLPAEYCDRHWYSYDACYRWHSEDSNYDSLWDAVHYDEEKEAIVCDKCGGVIEFYVMEGL